MSSQGKSYAVDSDLQGEIHSVIPKDPYHQQNLHRKRTSKATAYVASSPESDVSLLHRKLLEKDRIIGDLEERISNLTLTSQQAHSSLNTALEENVKFSKERDELAATMKNLRRDISKARLLKTENLGRELTDVIENEDLEELEILGSGTFGTVYRGKWRGADVAIKKRYIRPTGRSSKQKGLEEQWLRLQN